MDIVSQILNSLQMDSFGLASSQMREPWGIDFGTGEGAMVFHYVSSGQIWLRQDDAAPSQLGAGHLILLPTWKRIVLEAPRGSPGGRTMIEMMLASGQTFWTPGHSTPRPVRLNNDADGPKCQILSGLFGYEKRHASFLLERLPAVIHVDTRDAHVAPWLAQTLEFLTVEAQQDTPGYEAVASRLTGLIVIQILRIYMHRHTEQSPGWITGLSDSYIKKALVAIHRCPEQNWTVARLGSEAGLSRTAFAVRFASKTGMTPLDYVTRWRMHLAATRLMQTELSIAEIGVSVGYGTHVAFSRAFKRQYGLSPSIFRRNSSMS